MVVVVVMEILYNLWLESAAKNPLHESWKYVGDDDDDDDDDVIMQPLISEASQPSDGYLWIRIRHDEIQHRI